MKYYYTLSQLIKDATDALVKYGDIQVVADVLTENDSNLFDVCHGLDVYKGLCHITLDLYDFTVDEFKNSIK